MSNQFGHSRDRRRQSQLRLCSSEPNQDGLQRAARSACSSRAAEIELELAEGARDALFSLVARVRHERARQEREGQRVADAARVVSEMRRLYATGRPFFY